MLEKNTTLQWTEKSTKAFLAEARKRGFIVRTFSGGKASLQKGESEDEWVLTPNGKLSLHPGGDYPKYSALLDSATLTVDLADFFAHPWIVEKDPRSDEMVKNLWEFLSLVLSGSLK